MKQSSVDESTVRITKFPCTTIEPCLEGEEDYDPCANCHDITEKDLEILSKIEVGGRNAEVESKYKKEQDESSGKRKWDKERVGESPKKESSGKNIQKDNGRNSKSSRKLTDESTNEGRLNLKRGRETVGDDDNAVAAAASTIKPKRKTCHKKVKKNPFHRDRLALPSCASPPLRFPPPQLHPPADEDVECPNPKKPKPCRKKNVIREIKSKSKEKSKIEVQERAEQEVAEEQHHEETEEKTKEESNEEEEEEEEIKTEAKKSVEDIKKEAEKSVEEIKSEKETKAETSEKRISKAKPMKRSKEEEKPKKLSEFVPKNRKRIQKPCKKKVSQISISLLPPLIPPLQRDLPSICPKNIPEVERQALMAKETQRMMKRERCKSRLSNKAKNK